jgi:hypothetical protein
MPSEPPDRLSRAGEAFASFLALRDGGADVDLTERVAAPSPETVES